MAAFFPWREVIFNNKGSNDERSPADNNWKEVFTFLVSVTDVRVHNSPLASEDSAFVSEQTALLMMASANPSFAGGMGGKMLMIKWVDIGDIIYYWDYFIFLSGGRTIHKSY